MEISPLEDDCSFIQVVFMIYKEGSDPDTATKCSQLIPLPLDFVFNIARK